MTTRKIKCPFTGKMIDYEPRVVAAPNPKITEVTSDSNEWEQSGNPRLNELRTHLAELRRQWVVIGPGKRSGKSGDSLMKRYRKLALEYWHITGKHPDPIYAEL